MASSAHFGRPAYSPAPIASRKRMKPAPSNSDLTGGDLRLVLGPSRAIEVLIRSGLRPALHRQFQNPPLHQGAGPGCRDACVCHSRWIWCGGNGGPKTASSLSQRCVRRELIVRDGAAAYPEAKRQLWSPVGARSWMDPLPPREWSHGQGVNMVLSAGTNWLALLAFSS